MTQSTVMGMHWTCLQYTLHKERKVAFFVNMELSGKLVHMQVDTGASVSLIPESLYREQLKNCPLKPAAIHRSSYTGDTIPVLGKILVPVKYGEQEWELPLLVVKGCKPPLLGRNWLQIGLPTVP